MTEDILARIHREYRQRCSDAGFLKPFTDEEMTRAIDRWKAECNRLPEKKKRRRKNPKGHAD
jgi:hypothetical protein